MTTTTNPTTAEEPQNDAQDTPEPTEGPETPTDSPEGSTEPQEEPEEGGNREAAKYRRRLRDAEAENERLTRENEALKRAEIDRLATAEGIKPEALWASGATLAEMITADGTVDPARVTVAAKAAVDILGLQQRKGLHVPREGRNTGSPRSTTPTFADAFKPTSA